MKLWKRLVRFLARDEIASSQAAVRQANEAAFNAAVQVELREQVAYAKGEIAGRQQMADCILAEVAQRMGGGDDFVQPEDVHAAKKGSLH